MLKDILERVISRLGFSSRRRRERLRSEEHVLVSLGGGGGAADPVIGQILDINELGLSFRYPGVELRTAGACCLDLLVHGDPGFSVHGLPCRVVRDEAVERKSFLKLPPIRRCGVEFGDLTPEQLASLRRLIETHAA